MEAVIMSLTQFPVIDLKAARANIVKLLREHGLAVRDLQRYFDFEEPQAIYKWQRGQSLPTVDNLYALSMLLNVPMNEILVAANAPHIFACIMSGRPEPAAHLLCHRARADMAGLTAA